MVTVGKQFEKNFAMICFLLSPSGGKRKTHFSLQNSERPFCLPTVTPSPPVSAIMALNIMYRQKKTDGNRPRLPSVPVAFFVHNEQSIAVIRVVGLCIMMKLTIFQRKSQNIIDIYICTNFIFGKTANFRILLMLRKCMELLGLTVYSAFVLCYNGQDRSG